jgi:hypothetical protein
VNPLPASVAGFFFQSATGRWYGKVHGNTKFAAVGRLWTTCYTPLMSIAARSVCMPTMVPAQHPCLGGDPTANAQASMPGTGTSEVAYGQDHSRPEGVHPRLPVMAGEVPLKQNIPLEWVRGAERLQHLPAHVAVPAHRWRVFLSDIGHFLYWHWAERAADLGWDAASLFGCHPRRPLDHLQGAGLVWRLGGGKVVDMHSDWAVIEINGERQVVHRRPTAANFVLPWTLPYERPIAL